MNNLPLIVKILIAVVLCNVIGSLSGLSTVNAINDWYVTLNKPWFNPPNWIFGPAWLLLYTLMGVAAGLVWHKGLDRSDVRSALGIFAIQFILNAAWSLLFFGLRNPLIALIEIIVLWIFIALCIRKFSKIDTTAGWLMIPYILWVTFATILNISIVYLN